MILVSECHAALNGSDDFNDNSKDPARWGIDFTNGVGLLTETNGRLEYTTSSFSTSDRVALRPWILNFGSYTQNWEIHLDANLPQLGLRESRFGFVVVSGTNVNFSNIFGLVLAETPFGGRFFEVTLGVNGVEEDTVFPTASTSVGLRIAFDANTKTLSAFYDEDGPNCGYAWTLLNSTNISAAWNMTGTNVFGVWIFGRVEGSVASSDNVFGDNFYASSGLTPSLGISLAGRKAVLAWSTNGASCRLEFTTTLTPPFCWQIVQDAPGIVSTNFTVTNTVSSDKVFYRLSR